LAIKPGAASAERLLKLGNEAFSTCAFEEARDYLQQAVDAGAGADAYARLGEVAYWLGDETTSFAARERAFRLYQDAGDALKASRVAMHLATASVELRGEEAVGNGWLQRAHHLINDLEPAPEHAMLWLWEGHWALMMRNDAASTDELCGRAIELARRFGDRNVEMFALAVQGLAHVTGGRLERGISQLDEAATAVLAGELDDIQMMGGVLCYLMDACDRVRDYGRASQWCSRIRQFVEGRGVGVFYAVCRPHYAVVLMWRGEWAEAEGHLAESERDLQERWPPMVTEAVVRMAELRWRQGRWDEAERLFRRVEHEGLSQLGRAELALSQGEPVRAADLAEQYLRRMPRENRIERAAGLELMIRARAAHCEIDAAEEHLAELRDIAEQVQTAPFLGWTFAARGVVASARGDHDEARRQLEDAIFQFEKSGAPFEAARARLELATALVALERTPLAAEEAQMALDTFRRLGAAKEAERAVSLLGRLGAGAPAAAIDANPAGLTTRERDILRLIAAGKSNQEIAAELVLSLRTVERHLSNIYDKIGAGGKVARAAATSYAFQHGLV
jgi:DNA-binding NarL/FixJ family response regulator